MIEINVKLSMAEYLRLKELEKHYKGLLKGILELLEREELTTDFLQDVCKITLKEKF